MFGDNAKIVGIGVASAIAFSIITLLHVVVGELAPKSLAIARNERVVFVVAPIMRGFYLVTRPVVDLFNGMGNLLLKPFGIPPAREVGHAPASEDELRTLLRESAAGGEIEEDEQRFSENVLTFGDRRVREVMVPRRRVMYATTDDVASTRWSRSSASPASPGSRCARTASTPRSVSCTSRTCSSTAPRSRCGRSPARSRPCQRRC